MTGEEQALVESLEARLGYAYPDRRHALTALTHRSWVNEHPESSCGDNERLEFLGDAVIGLCVSRELWRRLPDAPEGQLSRMRAALVNAGALADTSRRLGLGELLRLGKGEDSGGGREKPSLLADVFEAVVGAVFVADSLGAAQSVVARHLMAHGPTDLEEQDPDHKSRLQQLAQGDRGQTPRYRLLDERGPEHEKIFEVEVMLGADAYGRGRGRSKKSAQQAAAAEAVRRLEAEIEAKNTKEET